MSSAPMTLERRRAGRNFARGNCVARSRIACSMTSADSATLGRPTTKTTPSPPSPMSSRASLSSLCVKTTSWGSVRHRALGRPGELLPDEPVAKSARPNPGRWRRSSVPRSSAGTGRRSHAVGGRESKLFAKVAGQGHHDAGLRGFVDRRARRAWMRAALRPSPY